MDTGHSTLTIDASTTMPLVPGLVMKPLLRRFIYDINFSPFIPRGAAPRKRDKKSDRLMPGSLVLDSQTWCFGWPGRIAPGMK